jgi:glycosyltransferase involved in cell wall biosynthesis
MDPKINAVHVTHEAIGKIGGIGAVLEGLFTSESYQKEVGRSILVSPLFNTEGDLTNRLGPDGEVLYSSLDGLTHTSCGPALRQVEDAFNVNIVYGRRTFNGHRCGSKSSPEVLLIDITRMEEEIVNVFKQHLFQEFGIRSDMYENLWEYEQWTRLALPTLAAIKAIGAADHCQSTVIISHEYMGMPTALAAKLDDSYDFKTVFYAHEVASIRPIVEKHPGHDTMFYNVMRESHKIGVTVNDVFGDQSHFFKHALVDASRFCDNILAVGDYVVDELKFLAPEFDVADIDLTYNGIPAYQISYAEKQQSKERLQEYCDNLLGYKPDYVFTHVTRMTPSKGLWRDCRVLEHMEREFRAENKTAVLIILSTEVGKRRTRDIYNMEAKYNWPVAHREGMPDMSGGESLFYTGVQEFNSRSRNIKIVYINQFGFDRASCGGRMPADMEFMDIRKGSDVEFGQSIYEPFGIAQLEPLSFGGICVVTNVCGCAGFVNDITGGEEVKNVIIADYTDLGDYAWHDIDDLQQIGKAARDHIEHNVSQTVALEICARLPKNEREIVEMIDKGYELAKHMSWEAVVKNYVLKSLHKAIRKQHNKSICNIA